MYHRITTPKSKNRIKYRSWRSTCWSALGKFLLAGQPRKISQNFARRFSLISKQYLAIFWLFDLADHPQLWNRIFCTLLFALNRLLNFGSFCIIMDAFWHIKARNGCRSKNFSYSKQRISLARIRGS